MRHGTCPPTFPFGIDRPGSPALASAPKFPETIPVKKFLVFTLLAAGAWFWIHEPAASWRGMPAAKDPVQLTSDLPPPFVHGRYTISPLSPLLMRNAARTAANCSSSSAGPAPRGNTISSVGPVNRTTASTPSTAIVQSA